ncbi:alkylation response protein AidB-like acyl-CoA dehydrogenase [Microbacterium sp. SLBN-154]|uniref:acyl-CoA dehydrogenase family protein n=1 Tax=Microbacterium sp. SLBN-154 TaxID=2768458 RepID=UPI001150A822|nr:acyl-CoA dehydrogenase family protein [Microbacterium sp. SLBN-154]TQK20675.1 alkylation response protein AidB-like acyl-CoA dehydrogenase [Microbacterium sp. SLBN-154]
MTAPLTVTEDAADRTASTATLVERYRPVFDEIGRGAAARENDRRLPFAEVELLRASGFTRVTLPRDLGGEGADHLTLFELLAELARRDPNLAQLLRSHFAFVDRTLHAGAPSAIRARLARIADGAIHGNATFERGPAGVGAYATTLSRDDRGWRLDGRKYYSTGTLFADVVGVLAVPDATTGLGPDPVSVLVATDAPGLTRVDDWDGFGQRMTGSGSTIFDGVRVAEGDVLTRSAVPGHAGAFVQLVLLAALTGIGRAVVDDATRFVRERTRSYSHASADRPRHDPIVQEVVGDLSAASFGADAALSRAVAALQRAADAQHPDSSTPCGDEDRAEAVVAADLATAQAQLVIIPAVLKAATDLFEVGGASALGGQLALDRHWRNARALASHNPARYKARIVGDHLVNTTPIVAWWTSGEA